MACRYSTPWPVQADSDEVAGLQRKKQASNPILRKFSRVKSYADAFFVPFYLRISKIFSNFAAQNQNKNTMSYMQMAQLDVLNLVKGIQTEGDYNDFRNMLARYFADKAQKQIDALWENGKINEQTIEQWGNERMRTPYRYAVHRSWHQLSCAGITFQ